MQISQQLPFCRNHMGINKSFILSSYKTNHSAEMQKTKNLKSCFEQTAPIQSNKIWWFPRHHAKGATSLAIHKQLRQSNK